MLEQPILPRKHLKQRQVGIIAHGEDVGAGTLTDRQMLPTLRIPTGQLSILNRSARGAAVTQQYQIRIGMPDTEHCCSAVSSARCRSVPPRSLLERTKSRARCTLAGSATTGAA